MSECEGYVNMNCIENGEMVTCSKCNTMVPETFIQEYKEVTDFTEMHLQSMKDTACILYYTLSLCRFFGPACVFAVSCKILLF